MIKVKLGRLINAIPSLFYLTERKMPMTTARLIGKLVTQVSEEQRDFQNQVDKYYEKNGKPVEGKEGIYELTLEQQAELQAEVDKLTAVEIELPYDPFSLEELGSEDIAPKHLVMLDFMLTDE